MVIAWVFFMVLFPAGIAEGEAFCNRVVEKRKLKEAVEQNRHIVLMAPRRYSKTSLIKKIMTENEFIYVWIDFLSVTSLAEVEEKIKKATKELAFKLAPELQKLKLQAKEMVKQLSPELNLGALGQTLTLHFTSDQTLSIDEALLQLDEYASKTGKRAVFVCDEFQQVGQIEQNKSVEALIRHAVERSRSIAYIFSGSNRHLLMDMFSKSDRPLYRLCQPMTIARISEADYALFLNEASLVHWKEPLPDEVFQAIMELTECHPYYVNALCWELWCEENHHKTRADIESLWSAYVDAYKGMIIDEIVPLSLNQKKLVSALAVQAEKEPYGIDFSLRVKMNSASIRRALEALLVKDIIYMDANKAYRLVDPAVKYYFRYK